MAVVAGYVAGALGLTAGAAGAAAGTFAAGAALGAAAGILTQVAIRIATSVALSALSTALGPKPKKPSIPGLRTDATLSGGINPEGFVLGRFAVNGVLAAPWMSHGTAGKTPNAYLNYVIELQGVPGAELDGVLVNGEAVPILEDDPHPDYGRRLGGRFEGRAWVRYHDGSQTEADAMLLAKYPAPLARPWTSDMVGHGIAYVVLTCQYDREVFTAFPTAQWVLKGLRLYDPRKDSTAGGSGSQRWANPATWTFTENPVVTIYNILRGITLPGGEVWGGGIPAEDLPHAVWAAAMDACDEPVDDGDGGTEPQFRAGREVFVDDEPFGVIEALLDACTGKLAERGGVWTIRVGAPALPVLAFTDDDLLADAPDTYAPFPRLTEIYNAISATWTSPEDAWQPRDAEALTNPAWEAEDDDRRLMASVELGPVTSGTQVQRLMAAMIADHRRMRVHQIVLPPAAIALDVLDTVAWTSASNSYTAKLFEVVRIERELQTGRVAVTLREIDADDFTPPAVVRPSAPDTAPVIPAVQAVPGWAVEPYTVEDADSTARRAAVRATWDAEGADDARGLRIYYRLAGEAGAGTAWPLVDPRDGEAILELLPDTAYELRARYVADRPLAWSAWESVTTPDVRLSARDLADDLAGDLGELHDWIDAGVTNLPGTLGGLASDIGTETAERIADVRLAAERWREQRDAIRAAAASAVELASAAYAQREELRTTISATLGDMTASIDQQFVVLAGETSAAALAISQLQASGNSLTASLQAVDQARIDGDSALASMIASLAVGTATQFDHTQIWYFDAGVEGWTGAPNSPSVADGWLRPGSGSDLRSPAGLVVDGDAYQQVRARVRKVGGPTWQGWLWWAGEGEGWDSARRITLAEPSWDGNGIGLVTFEPGWSGGIDRLRIELASGGDGSNYHELDWVAVGRPAPGASSAELLAERQARIDGDEAVAEDVLALQGRMDDAEDGVGLNADAISGLTTRVGNAEGALGGHSTRLLSLEASVNDPVTGNSGLASAIDQLEGSVLYDDGSQRYQAESIRDLRTQARRQAAQSVDAAATAAQTAAQVREYLAEASQILGTRIDLTDDQVRIVAEAITTLQAAIPGLATATALQALTTRVSETESGIEANAQDIVSLQTVINHPTTGLASKLAASAITDYYTKTETNSVASSAASGATTALKSEMEGAGGSVKAAQDAAQAASDLAGGKGKVFFQATAPAVAERLPQNLWIDTTGSANTPKRWSGSAWVAVQDKAATDALAAAYSLASTKADASAVSSLSTRVGDAEGEIEAFGDALTALGASVGPYTAKGLFRVTAEAAPAGALARIGLTAVASDTEGSGRTAALFLEAIAGDKSQVIVQADRFAIADGSGRKFPFVIDGGEIILDAIGLRSANYAESGGVPTAGFSLDPATGAIRGAGVIQGRALVANGITRQGVAGSGPTTYETSVVNWKEVCSFTLASMPLPSYVQGLLSCTFTDIAPNLGMWAEIRVTINGTVAHNEGTRFTMNTHSSRTWTFPFTKNVPAGDIAVAFEMRGFDSGKGILSSNLSAIAAMR